MHPAQARLSEFEVIFAIPLPSSTPGVLAPSFVNQAIQNNMYSVLTDCPHREKLGWLEEAHLVFQSVSRRYDVAAYYRQLLRQECGSPNQWWRHPS
jgi:alpha-L-rhamnosidase-like protein